MEVSASVGVLGVLSSVFHWDILSRGVWRWCVRFLLEFHELGDKGSGSEGSSTLENVDQVVGVFFVSVRFEGFFPRDMVRFEATCRSSPVAEAMCQ